MILCLVAGVGEIDRERETLFNRYTAMVRQEKSSSVLLHSRMNIAHNNIYFKITTRENI
jgi:hypothetical protein